MYIYNRVVRYYREYWPRRRGKSFRATDAGRGGGGGDTPIKALKRERAPVETKKRVTFRKLLSSPATLLASLSSSLLSQTSFFFIF